MSPKTVALTVAVALASICLGAASSAVASSLPDLVPDPPEDLHLDYTDGSDGGFPKMLVRFTSFIHNAGPGPLEIHGSDPQVVDGEPQMTHVVQRIFDTSAPTSSFTDVDLDPGTTIRFQPSLGHNHWHFFDPVVYFLKGLGESTASQLFDKAQVGFCFIDTETVEANSGANPYYTKDWNDFCAMNNPSAPSVGMGISPGWRDAYIYTLPLQWIDVSAVTPGRYRISSVVDPNHHFFEANEDNNRSEPLSDPEVTVPGWLPESRVMSTPAAVPLHIQLTAAEQTSAMAGAELPGPAQFQIVSPPSHGKLVSLSALTDPGGWNAGEFLYQPAVGFTGEDRFDFAVRDSYHTLFPYTKPEGHVRILVG